MSYTKGKWYRFGGLADNYGVACQTDKGRIEIVHQELDSDTAALIAASPALLEALELCRDVLSAKAATELRLWDYVRQADAALAAAEGKV